MLFFELELLICLKFSQVSTSTRTYGKRPELSVNHNVLQRVFSFVIFFTSSRDNWIGTLFSFVHCILTDTLLQVAPLKRSQLGSSNSSVNTSSFNSKFFSSPSPFKVDKWIWSWDRFLANLKWQLLSIDPWSE